MLNVRAYLPATEDFDSLPDTLASDISTDGDNTYLAGIPEELILPLDNSEQGNENDDTIVDNLQEQNEKTEEVKESEEDGTELSADENEESTELEVSEKNENTDNDDSLDTTQVEDDPDKQLDDEEEDKIADVQYAIESYSELLRTAGNSLTHQSAAFLHIGLSRIQKQLGITSISNENFVDGPLATRTMYSAEAIGEKLKEAGKAAWAKILELWNKLKGWFSKLFSGVEEKKEENVYLLQVLAAAEAGPDAVDKVPEPPTSPTRKPFKAGEAIARFKKMQAAQKRAKEWQEQADKDNAPSAEVTEKTYSTVPRVLFMIGESNELSFDGTGELEVLDYIEKSWIPAIGRVYDACATIVNSGKPEEITEGFLKVIDGHILSEYTTPTILVAGNSTFNPIPDHLGWAIRNTTDGDGTTAKLGIKSNDPNALIAGKANEKVLTRLGALKPVTNTVEKYIDQFEKLVEQLKGNDEAMSVISRVSRACNIYDIGRTLSYIENRVKTRIHFMDLVAAATIQHNTL